MGLKYLIYGYICEKWSRYYEYVNPLLYLITLFYWFIVVYVVIIV
jgi:hypothetical protein